jgi:glucose/arabinose dehydrogenase
MTTPTRAPRAAPAQPTWTDIAELFLVAVAEGVEEPVLLAFLLDAAAVVVAARAPVLAPVGLDWLARGAVDCPEIWD